MPDFDVELDTSGLNCPLPVLKARKALSEMSAGQRLLLIATDEGSSQDIPAFAKMTGNPLAENYKQDGTFRFILVKGDE
ncbi:MAG: sulfurtransferase TusA family protein [Methylophagaceae bacterium]